MPEPAPEPAPELAPEPVPEPAPPEICAMGTWNELYLAEQVGAWQVEPCPGCLQHGAGVKLTGSTPRGIGSGTLDFRCKGCNAPRFLKRSRALTGGGLVGMDRDKNTERLAGAFDFAGIGYAQASTFLSGSDQPLPNKSTWWWTATPRGSSG